MSLRLRTLAVLVVSAHIALLMSGCAHERTREAAEVHTPRVKAYVVRQATPKTKIVSRKPAAKPAQVRAAEVSPPAVIRPTAVGAPARQAMAPDKPSEAAAVAPPILRKIEPSAAPETTMRPTQANARPAPVQRPVEVERPALTERPGPRSEPAEAARQAPRSEPVAAKPEPETPKLAPVASAPAVPAAPAQAPTATPPPGPTAPARPTAETRRQAGVSAPVTSPAPSAAPRPADKSSPQDAVATAIDRANLLLRIGNVQGARDALADAVKARNGEAISELGRTYDQNELQGFLVPPGTADPAKALELYTEAARLGSSSARVRLEKLKAGSAAAPAPKAKN